MNRLLLFPVLAFVVVGCRQRDMTLAVDSVSREYAKTYEETWEGVLDLADEKDMRVERQDREAGEIVAVDGSARHVTFVLKSEEPMLTWVLIHVDPNDVDHASALHEALAGELGLGEAKSSFLLWGGESVSGRYLIDLETAVRAARRSYKALDFQITRESQNHDIAEIDGRMKDSRPLRIKIERTSDGLEVTFVAGTSKNDDNRTFATSLKVEFERSFSP